MSQPSDNSAASDTSRVALPSISSLLDIAGARSDNAQGQPTASYYGGSSQAKRPVFDPNSAPKAPGADVVLNQFGAPDGNTAAAYRYNPMVEPAINSSYAMEIDSAGPSSLKRQSAQSYDMSPYSTKPYATSPSAASDGSLYSPTMSLHRQVGPYGGPAGPSAYPPSNMSTPNLPAANPWEHHHYIGASSQQGIYAQLPDRYICQTCSKAFSRPSSLKIHSHSHTGEKPFKCPHAGCNKAFSVKSNMKRHEKGCHSGNGQALPGAYMSED